MRTLWHLAWQSKADRPVDSAALCQLAAKGAIRPTDLVRRSGSKRWTPAGEVEGLFNGHDRRWFYIAGGQCFGPVSFRSLWKQAKAGEIGPEDLVWKPGHWRARPASKIVGLFPASPTENASGGPATVPGEAVHLPGDPAPAWCDTAKLPWCFRVSTLSVDGSSRIPSGLERDEPSALASGTPRRQRARRGDRYPSSRSESRRLAGPIAAERTASQCGRAPGWPHFTVFAVVILIAAAVLLLAARRLAPATGPNESAIAARAVTHRPAANALDPPMPREPAKRGDTASHRAQLARESFGNESLSEPSANGPVPVQTASATPGPDSRSRGLPDDEIQRIGREVHELIMARHRVLKNDVLRHRLERAAASLVAQQAGTKPPVQFTLLDSDEAFAFSHLGGYVYVSRGLFHFVRNDAELQFILGCEIAHVDLGHLQRAAAIVSRQDATSSPARRVYRQIAVGFRPEDVFAADAWSYRGLRQLGLPGYQMIAWLSPSANLEGAEDPRGSLRSPATGPASDVQEIENHWRSRPPAADRYNRLLALDAVAPPQPNVAVRRRSH